MKPRIFGRALLLSIAMLSVACSKREKSGIQARLGEQAIAGETPVEALRLQAGDFDDSFMAPGAIEAWDEVTVSG